MIKEFGFSVTMASRPKIPSKKKKTQSQWWLVWLGITVGVIGFSIVISPDNSIEDPPPAAAGSSPARQKGQGRNNPKYDESKLPQEIHSGHVASIMARRDIDALHWGLTTVYNKSARIPNSTAAANPRWNALKSGFTETSRYKLQHDLEQAQYLAEHLADGKERNYFRKTVIPLYQQVLDSMPPEQDSAHNALYSFTPENIQAGIQNVYNKGLHVTNFASPKTILNPSLDTKAITQQWKDQGICVIDNILSEEALQIVYQIMLESTVFYQTKPPHKGKYVGAYLGDGLHDRILLELGQALSDALPDIFQGHPLNFLWAYKYDSQVNSGIDMHADEAAVNVNFWLTPDEANLDKTSGGLVVYTAKPPADWNFKQYNGNTQFVRESLLKPTNYANVTIPYRQNRCVVFDSALFHHTDVYRFQGGYTNRRINLTYLFGEMRKTMSKTEL
jgi:hypothetical protein